MKIRMTFFLMLTLLPAVFCRNDDRQTTEPLSHDGFSSFTLNQIQKFSAIAKTQEPIILEPSGVRYWDAPKDKGESPQKSKLVSLEATVYSEDGRILLSTLRDRTPIRYFYDEGMMPEVFDKAIAGMKPLGRRLIIFPKGSVKLHDKSSESERLVFGAGGQLIVNVTLLWVRDSERDKLEKFK